VSTLRFAGRAALVTGAGSGIGEATARLLSAEGGSVAVVDIDGSRAERVAGEIRDRGGAAIALRANVAEPEDVARMVAATVEAFGRLDLLHNNATSGGYGPIGEMSLEDWQRVVAVNLTAPFFATRAALPHMLSQGGGAIVNMSSNAGLMAEHGLGAYGAAKAGVVHLTRQIALEYGGRGIRANCISPGAIATPPTLAFAGAVPGMRERMERANPMRRLGLPEEVARVVLFLACDDSSFVNGVTICVDGGNASEKSIGLVGD
jgi:meso-butanediol dehydrogenase/(S,S)-butanediol dehydrogenase/diacetyl reductase